MKLRFLGTGAATAVPSFFCNCPACMEAARNLSLQRTRSCIALEGGETYLVDIPPDVRNQLLREHIKRIDALLLTHNHFDHCGGMGEIESYVRVLQHEPIPAYMTVESYEWFYAAYGYMADCISARTWDVGTKVELDGVVCTTLEVQHAQGTVGILLEAESGTRTAYLPDTGPLPDSTKRCLERVDTLILGAAFWGTNEMPDTHLSVQQAVDIGVELKVGELYLTHLSMHYQPVTDRELRGYLQSRGANLHAAYDGMCIEI